jgi:hypothetical protein
MAEKKEEKGALAKAVDKVLHPHADAAPEVDKPKKKGAADPKADFNQHPKFNKFKKGN